MAERDSGQPGAVEASGGAGRAGGATSFLQRAVIRRRVRFLRRRRELALHDLGGFVFESHRLGQPGEQILAEKLAALSALDDELAVLQRALDLREELAVLHEPGIAACPHCGALHDSSANFCPACGRGVHEAAPSPVAAAEPPATPQVAAEPAAAPAAVAEQVAAEPAPTPQLTAESAAPTAPAAAADLAAEPTTEEHEVVAAPALEPPAGAAAEPSSAAPADAQL